jgi:hypothetical protein
VGAPADTSGRTGAALGAATTVVVTGSSSFLAVKLVCLDVSEGDDDDIVARVTIGYTL